MTAIPPPSPTAAATLSARARDHLARPLVAVIGTTGEDGAPHQAVAWFRLDPDGRVLLNSRTPRRWPSDLRRDPRVTLAIVDPGNQNRWVGLVGRVETIVDDLDLARQDICDLAVRYDDAPPERLAEFRTQPRVSFRIRIEQVHEELD